MLMGAIPAPKPHTSTLRAGGCQKRYTIFSALLATRRHSTILMKGMWKPQLNSILMRSQIRRFTLTMTRGTSSKLYFMRKTEGSGSKSLISMTEREILLSLPPIVQRGPYYIKRHTDMSSMHVVIG